MYAKIIVPLDGSELAEGVLPYVRSLARGLGLPVTLLQVIDPEIISALADSSRRRYFDNVAAGMKTHAADYLRKLVPSFPEPSKVDAAVEIGKPAETIVRIGATHPDALMAMATHGRSGLRRWIVGSVADKVLHGASNHLLLIRPRDAALRRDEEARLKSLVVPLDGSELAESVLPHAIELARGLKAEIILLRAYALPLSMYSVSDEYVPSIEELGAQLKAEAREYVEQKVKELRERGVDKASAVVVEGYGAAEIIDFAKKTPDNLIAMCTHGRSGVGRWVLGSVTERVVQHSGDPVLVIRAQST
ncbi:MAG TPA: universal stress protein [Candidatus Acidoferrales bacterium]|nr:universal stress protein [Candidatus Acidoferrales bacterium]